MLCTDCSRPVVPVVAVDIDGTLGDYHGHFLDFARQYLGLKDVVLRDYTGKQKFKNWFCSVTGVDERTWNDIKLSYRQGGMKRSMPVYDGANRFCRTLRDDGVELWLTTTRPYMRLDNVDPDTRFWLDRHGIKFDGLLYDEDKYRILSEYVDKDRVVAIIDDLPEQIDAACQAFHWSIPILRRNPYNEGVAGGVGPLEVILQEVTERVREWRINYD